MSELIEIIDFVKDISGIDELNAESDIFNQGVVGDDFNEMMDKYSKKFDVDMSEYLWYFHTDEEGQNFGALFFKPPYSRVQRIKITPSLLTEFTKTKKWVINYPEHKLPKKRFDIAINNILILVFILVIMTIWILK